MVVALYCVLHSIRIVTTDFYRAFSNSQSPFLCFIFGLLPFWKAAPKWGFDMWLGQNPKKMVVFFFFFNKFFFLRCCQFKLKYLLYLCGRNLLWWIAFAFASRDEPILTQLRWWVCEKVLSKRGRRCYQPTTIINQFQFRFGRTTEHQVVFSKQIGKLLHLHTLNLLSNISH